MRRFATRRSSSIFPAGLASAVVLTVVITVVITVVTGLVLADAAWAGTGPGTEAVRKANETVAALLRKKVAPGSAAEKKLAGQVTESVRDLLDTGALGRRALRDHWDGLDKTKRAEFLTLLRKLIESNYVKGLRANLSYKVTYTGEKKRGDDIVVSTEIATTRRGRPITIPIEYVLRRDGGSLRAFDIITDGVGLVENYRAQFNKIIAKRGFDDLLARMKKRVAKLDG